MYSVASQTAFKTSMEYLLIDDGSNDNTCELMGKFAVRAKNTYWFRNPSNVGLASSSNIALKKARGKYIIRLDADDFFSSKESIMEMVNQMEEKGFEALYPDNYFGDYKTIQSGDSNHHVGGALFNKKAVNFIKFTEGLKGYEGLDFFVRAQDKLNIGYYRKPIFFYRQHDDSLTKNNHEERESIRQSIIEGSLNL
jgi:glycosyltransferase involved in cell wall biosynthesis